MTTKTEKQKMLSGEPYRPGDPELAADARRARAWMVRYNATLAASPDERRVLLRELLGHVGEGAVIRPPFFCDYGQHIAVGDGVFLNFNCVILDVAPVSIGDLTQVGPG
ncbi:MAG: sugar O-acetyltransferase, partial [Parafilimonas terrae]|nr:sugar O-acetyltransferase [Parafilimonas terrae]